MATVQQCEEALRTIADRLAEADAALRDKIAARRVACRIPDLDVTFVGELRDGGLHDVVQTTEPKAHITLTVGSDDLVAMTDGDVSFTRAIATGKVRISAGFRDLLTLRSLL